MIDFANHEEFSFFFSLSVLLRFSMNIIKNILELSLYLQSIQVITNKQTHFLYNIGIQGVLPGITPTYICIYRKLLIGRF